MSIRRYFLAGNTADGFFSCYKEAFLKHDSLFLYVIKGCPGCGKSTFMRRIGDEAEKRGYNAEYVQCSGDPKSIDAVIIPELALAYIDGTSPHILEPSLPGLTGAYVDFSAYINPSVLKEAKEEALLLKNKSSESYRAAYILLSRFHQPEGLPEVPEDGLTRFSAAITRDGIIQYEDFPEGEAKENPEHFPSGNFIYYRHPLWPNVLWGKENLQTGEKTSGYTEIPDITDGVYWLHIAGDCHDRLEKLYASSMDFSGIDELFEKHKKIFRE